MQYRVTVPPTRHVGSYATTISCRRQDLPTQALWDYNSCRAHDGHPPITRMPPGTKYQRIK